MFSGEPNNKRKNFFKLGSCKFEGVEQSRKMQIL